MGWYEIDDPEPDDHGAMVFAPEEGDHAGAWADAGRRMQVHYETGLFGGVSAGTGRAANGARRGRRRRRRGEEAPHLPPRLWIFEDLQRVGRRLRNGGGQR